MSALYRVYARLLERAADEDAKTALREKIAVAYAVGVIAAVAYVAVIVWYGNKRASRLISK